jgi:hypothetical protein
MEIHYICSMDYKRIYDNLMQTRLLLKEDRIKLRKQGEYFEAHHIVPRSMGGEGKNKEYRHPNLVMLTLREHYIAHALLWLIYRNREMATAFNFMCIVRNKNEKNRITSSRMYEEVKRYLNSIERSPEHRQKLSKALLGRKLSIETKQKIRQASLGKKMSPEAIEKTKKANLGKKRSPEQIENMRQAQLGKKVSIETKQKISKAKLGKKQTLEHKEKVRLANLRKKVSDETKEKLRQINLGKKMSPEAIAKSVGTRKRNRLLKLAQMEGSGGQGG